MDSEMNNMNNMNSIKKILLNLRLDNNYKKYGILLVSIMFIWSGINKILNFDKKVNTLMNKINIEKNICIVGMLLVILLEIIGFVLLLEYYYKGDKLYKIFDNLNMLIKISQKELIQIILICLLLFLIVVTAIYHPLNIKRPIPFLSNLTIFGFTLYIYSDLF